MSTEWNTSQANESNRQQSDLSWAGSVIFPYMAYRTYPSMNKSPDKDPSLDPLPGHALVFLLAAATRSAIAQKALAALGLMCHSFLKLRTCSFAQHVKTNRHGVQHDRSKLCLKPQSPQVTKAWSHVLKINRLRYLAKPSKVNPNVVIHT